MRQGPPRRPLATCFRAVGNELQAAVQCECRAVGGAASPLLEAGQGALTVGRRSPEQAHATGRTDGDPLSDGVFASQEGWVYGAWWAMGQL